MLAGTGVLGYIFREEMQANLMPGMCHEKGAEMAKKQGKKGPAGRHMSLSTRAIRGKKNRESVRGEGRAAFVEAAVDGFPEVDRLAERPP